MVVVRVLDHVVEKRGGDGRIVSAQLREDLRDTQRVKDEVLAATALLVGVRLGGEVVRALQQIPIDIGVVGRHLGKEPVEQLVMPLGGRGEHLTRHGLILAPGVPVSCPRSG